MNEITLNAYAKINLSLEVTGRRADGYHDIRSLMQGIDLHDVINLTICPANGTKYNFPHCIIDDVVVYLCTDAKTIPADMSNLAFRGIKAVLDGICGKNLTVSRDCAPDDVRSAIPGDCAPHGVRSAISGDCAPHGVRSAIPGELGRPDRCLIIGLDKRLPVAAGIAGGSGNAAACMLGLNALLGNPFGLRELMSIGAAAGADVSFSIFMNARKNADALEGLEGLEESSTAAMTGGIGDIVIPVRPAARYVVMANPGIQVSTRAAYEAIDAIQAELQGGRAADGCVDASGRSRMKGSGLSAVEMIEGQYLVNDLELYTLRDYPEAARLRQIMAEELDADSVLMSGSGPTMVAYFRDRAQAERGFGRMLEICGANEGWRVWMTRTGE